MKQLKPLHLAFLVVAFGLVSSFHRPVRDFNDGSIQKIVIDAGHGGKDPGALGSSSKEKNVTLGIAKELKRIINENAPEINVVMTRDDDTFVELHKRAAHVKEHEADFFISIHCNSSSNKSAYGTETYVLGSHRASDNMEVVMRENSVILEEDDHEHIYEGFDPNSDASYIFFNYLADVHLEQSDKMARLVQHQFTERVGRKNRGVKQAGYIVLWKASKPSILIETGFISNKEEEKFLTSEQGKVYLASAIYRSIKEFNDTMK